MHVLDTLPKPFLVLAPMDDVTDTVFRQIVAWCGRPDLFFTEFVNVDGLQSPGRPQLLKRLQFTAQELPLVAQLWGKNPDNFYKTAREIGDGSLARELGLPEGVNFSGVDINMGCPDKTVVKNGACSALMNNRQLAEDIIKATQAGAGDNLPVSIKTRLGFNDVDLSWHEFLLQQDVDMLTIHVRTRKEMSKVPAHWEYLEAIRNLRDHIAPQTLLVGNGDVSSRAQALQLARQYGLEGIMIGRGVFEDPFIFANRSQWSQYSRKERLVLFAKQVSLFSHTWKNNERPVVRLNKFCKIYIQNFDGAKELREQCMNAHSADELLMQIHAAVES